MKRIVLLLLLLLCFSGCSRVDDSITVGVLIPLTGTEAVFGQDMLASYELAVEEINAAGGVLGHPLQLLVQDDGCEPAQAVNAASRLISAGADVITGGYCSGSTSPTLCLFDDAGLIFLVSGANSTDLSSQGHPQTFLMNPTARVQAGAFIDFIHWYGDIQKIALIHQGDSYTANLSSEIEKNLSQEQEFTVVTRGISEKNTADYSAIVTSICYHDADLVMFAGYYADAANCIRQLRQGGYDGPVLLGDGCADPALIHGVGSYGHDVYVISPPWVSYIEGGPEYAEKYEAHTGGLSPKAFSTLCYDSVYTLAEAIEAAGSAEYSALLQALRNTDRKGLSGDIRFDETGERSVNNFMLLKLDPDTASFVLVENVWEGTDDTH